MEEKINQLKLEKQNIIEKAKQETRDLTEEEKKRGFEIDQEINNIANTAPKPTELVNTSVSMDMGKKAAETPVTIPEVPAPPVVEPNSAPIAEEPVAKPATPVVEPISAPVADAPVAKPATPVMDDIPAEVSTQKVVEEIPVATPVAAVESAIPAMPVNEPTIEPLKEVMAQMPVESQVAEPAAPVAAPVTPTAVEAETVAPKDMEMPSVDNVVHSSQYPEKEEVVETKVEPAKIVPAIEKVDDESTIITPTVEEKVAAPVTDATASVVSEVPTKTEETPGAAPVDATAKEDKPKKGKKIFIILLFIILLVLAGVLVYLNM